MPAFSFLFSKSQIVSVYFLRKPDFYICSDSGRAVEAETIAVSKCELDPLVYIAQCNSVSTLLVPVCSMCIHPRCLSVRASIVAALPAFLRLFQCLSHGNKGIPVNSCLSFQMQRFPAFRHWSGCSVHGKSHFPQSAAAKAWESDNSRLLPGHPPH